MSSNLILMVKRSLMVTLFHYREVSSAQQLPPGHLFRAAFFQPWRRTNYPFITDWIQHKPRKKNPSCTWHDFLFRDRFCPACASTVCTGIPRTNGTGSASRRFFVSLLPHNLTYNLELPSSIVRLPDGAIRPQDVDERYVLVELFGVQQAAAVKHYRFVRGQLRCRVLPGYI